MENADYKNMRPSAIFQIITTAAIVVLIASSCGNRETVRKMDTADAVMWTRPDSALAVLESIDTLDLRTEKRRARYSLLYTMALHKNWIDTADIRVIRPAERYYERHGSNEDKMRMNYYLGTVQQNAGDLESAISSYLRAKEYSSDSDDLVFRGLISSVISDVYGSNKNFYQSIVYSEEACDYFAKGNDSYRLWNTTGWLANYYLNVEDWTKADSLYAEFFSKPILDTAVYARQLLNYSWGYLFRPDSDPAASVDLFEKAVSEYGAVPTFNDYCFYAGALEFTGRPDAADDIVRQLEVLDSSSVSLRTWKYRIFKDRGNYKEALSLMEQSVKGRDSEVLSAVGQSVALAQSAYYENKSSLLEMERRIQSLLKWIAVVLCLLVIVSSWWIITVQRRKRREQFEEMSSINDEVTQRLNESLLCEVEHLRRIESLSAANQSAEKEIQDLSEKLSDSEGKEQLLMSLRTKYVQANKRLYAKLNLLCRQYLESSQSRKGKDRIYDEVKNILSILEESNQKELESMLDDSLDGIMTKLRAAMPYTTEKDFRFITFLILGFDTKTIARMMDYNVSTVYTKRYNLKDRISKLDSDAKDLFSEFIS